MMIALMSFMESPLPSFRQVCDWAYTHFHDQIWSIQGLIFIPLFCFLFRNNYKFRFFLCCAAATYTPVLIDYARGKTNEVAAYSSEKLFAVLEATQEGGEEGYGTIKEGVKEVPPALSEGASSLLEAGGSLVKNSKDFVQEKLGIEDEEEDFWGFSFLKPLVTKEKKEVPKMFFTLPKHYSFSALGAFALALFLHNETAIGKGFATSLLTVPLFFAYKDAKKFDVGLEYPCLSYTKGYIALSLFGALSHFIWSRTKGVTAFLIAALALSIPFISSKVYVYKVSKHLLQKGYERSPLEEIIDFVGKKVEEFRESNFYKKAKYALKTALIVVGIYLLWKYLSVLREKLTGEGGSAGDKKFEEKNRDHLKTIQEEAEEEILVMLISEPNNNTESAGRGFAMPKFIRIEEKQPWATSLLHLELLARQIGVPQSAIPRFVACAKILEWAIHNGEKTRADFERFVDARGMILLEGEELVIGFGFDEGIQDELRRMQRHQRLVERQQRRMRTRTRTADQLREENEERHTRASENRQNAEEQRAAQQQRQNDHLEAVHERYEVQEAEAEQRLREEHQRREEEREAATQRREEALEDRRAAQNRYNERLSRGLEQLFAPLERLANRRRLSLAMTWYAQIYYMRPIQRRINRLAAMDSIDPDYIEQARERLRRLRQRLRRQAQQTTDDPTEATHTRENDNGRTRVQDRERITTGGRGGQRRGSRNNPRTESSDKGIDSNNRRRWGAYSALLGRGMAKDFEPFKPNPRHVHRLTKATSGVKKAFEEKKNQQWFIGQRKKNIETLTRLQDEESKDWWLPRTMKRIFRGNDVEEALEKNYSGLQQAHTQLKTAEENYQKTYKKTYKKQEAKVRKSSPLKLKNGLAQKGGEVAAGMGIQYLSSTLGTLWNLDPEDDEELQDELMAIDAVHDLDNRQGLDYVKGRLSHTANVCGVIGKKIYEDAPEIKKTGATSLASTVGSTLGWFAGAGLAALGGADPSIGGQIGSSLLSTGGVVATDALMEQEDAEKIDAAEVAGSAVGAAVGSFIPVVGTIAGTFIGKTAVKVYKDKNKAWEDTKNTVKSAFDSVGSAIEKTTGWFSSWWS